MPGNTTIINALAGPDLNFSELIDPDRIQFYANSLGNQINDFRLKFNPQKRIVDLSDWISDVTIETSAQGASLLTVSVIDPAWVMFQRDKNGVCFIDSDDQGYLWPPVEVTFPPDISDATWRLCECQPSTDLTQANVVLTFEDKIVSELREHFGAQQSLPNQTRAEFIQLLIKQANANPAYPSDVPITFVHLLPKSTFTLADLTLSERVPQSARQLHPPKARKDHKKGPMSPQEQAAQQSSIKLGQMLVDGTDISIKQGLDSFAFANPQGLTPITPIPPGRPAGGFS